MRGTIGRSGARRQHHVRGLRGARIRWARAGLLRSSGMARRRPLGLPDHRWVPRTAFLERNARSGLRHARSHHHPCHRRGPSARGPRTETLDPTRTAASGPVFDNETRRFTPPVAIYAFPMSPGQRWGGWVDNFNETAQQAAQINRTVSVGNWTRRRTMAGTFDAAAARAHAPRRPGVLARADGSELPCSLRAGGGRMVRADKNAHFVQSGAAGSAR